MEISLDLRKRIEAYLKTIVTALQQEDLAPSQVDRAVEMLREQIHETLHERAEKQQADEALVENVLDDMPSPGEFALEAAQVAGKSRKPTDVGTLERVVRFVAFAMTVVIFCLCMEGSILGIRSMLGEQHSDSQGELHEYSPDSTAETLPTAAAASDVPENSYDDGGPFLILPFLLAILIIFIALVFIILGMAAVVVFGVGLLLLGCSLAALNTIVSLRRRSWMTFMRLCAWELIVVAGTFAGMVLGGIVWWVLQAPVSWRVFGYSGLAIGAVLGLAGAWIAIRALNYVIVLIIRHKQRHLPLLKLAVLSKLEAVVSSSRQL